jgi:uncharacterized damage-inducible protein DinB
MRSTGLLALIPLLPSLLSAQSAAPPDLLADWQRSRSTVLAYVAAMPDSATDFRPTPGVRTFAEQFDHVVTTNVYIASVVRGLSEPPKMADPAVYLHNKEALRNYVAAAYAYVIATVQGASSEELQRPASVFGLDPQPAVRLLALSLEHSVWTLGQVVPYLRLNHVTPPDYQLPL